MLQPPRCTPALIALAGAILSCAPDDPAPSRPEGVTRDSAGIRIVESGGDGPRAVAWSLASEPQWVVGELDGDPRYLLSGVVGAMTVAEGAVVIADNQSSELRFFDPEGRWLRTLGGPGEGPGEFEYLRALAPCHPGGFVGFDLNWQMNRYLLDGTFVEKTVLTAPSGISPYTLACDADGHTLLIGWGRAMDDGPLPVGFYQAWDDLLLVGPEGEVSIDFGSRLASERIGTQYGSSPHPAGRATRFALHDGRAYIGSGERFEVEIWSLDGVLQQLVRGPPLPLQVTDSVRGAYLASALAAVNDPAEVARVRREIEAMEWPAGLPAFTEVRVDPLGVIWVKRYRVSGGDVERWSLLHPERAYLGDLSLAPGQRLLEIGEQSLLVRIEGALGVEQVARLALDRRGG